jgi:hypothetical protein
MVSPVDISFSIDEGFYIHMQRNIYTEAYPEHWDIQRAIHPHVYRPSLPRIRTSRLTLF